MSESNFKTPGVYINELNAFPNSVVAVPTAVPAFVGYTPQAECQGESCLGKAQKVTSFADFKSIYGFPDPAAPADPAIQYSPRYYLLETTKKTGRIDDLTINGRSYIVRPDPNTIYYFYNSIRMFYENGGGDAYIVSVGSYGAPSGIPAPEGTQIRNPNVKLADLQRGIALLKNEAEPTMYVCPEATLLSVEDNGALMQTMLLQCQEMRSALSIFDVIGGRDPDPMTYRNDIETFRNHTGSQGLQFGVCYYPFVGTTIVRPGEINYTNLFGGDIKQLAALLNPTADPNPGAASILAAIETPPAKPLTVSQYDQALKAASPAYTAIAKHLLDEVNILPPSGAIPGVYQMNDSTSGVWTAPANTGILGVRSLTIELSDSEQQFLNVDAISGKSVNAIRTFIGRGIVIWGARTLDGNSQEWRYIPARRLMSMIEQSCKFAIQAYVFAPNTSNTWISIRSMLNNFLINIWKQGGLQGTTAAEAFRVECGLGTTMTQDDVLNGILNITIMVAVVRPAEFMILNFSQQMQES